MSEPDIEGRSDLKVVLQFFIVPLSLVAVLVSVFFGLQMLRSRRPDAGATLDGLRHYEGFLAPYVGDVKRWQSGYDLSLLLRSEDRQARSRVLPDLVSAFREAGERRDLKLRRYLALALGQSGDARAAAALREGAHDGDAQTRLFSVWGLMQAGGAPACPELRAAAADPDRGVRAMAVFALGALGDRSSEPVLRAALQDRETDVRWNAALALARLGDPAAVPVLIQMLDAPGAPAGARGEGAPREGDAALNAIRGLALLRAPEGRQPLARLAASAPDLRIREAARLAIDAYGAAPRPGAP
ncbi:MAG: hypothetical protein DMF50_02810 [Acidobacteria bacterium]|nr:MAG: hypothetical protein DMF50_02810 [Acidobacteriota bacterium]